MEDVSKMNYLMVDPYTCKPFRATKDEVDRIQKEINSRIDSDGHISRYDLWNIVAKYVPEDLRWRFLFLLDVSEHVGWSEKVGWTEKFTFQQDNFTKEGVLFITFDCDELITKEETE